ncbi:hypothetical protein RF11_08713 [Thelohanellus kitauei]|uniref:Uncharacterized protein n=1 Tax=Thelohanellus kitauei TaxID=669202 RepID=A0A0C2J6F1_THEKT|nr:hypothetical protein RF11_08713 [Thelohanellus kitauei]
MPNNTNMSMPCTRLLQLRKTSTKTIEKHLTFVQIEDDEIRIIQKLLTITVNNVLNRKKSMNFIHRPIYISLSQVSTASHFSNTEFSDGESAPLHKPHSCIGHRVHIL